MPKPIKICYILPEYNEKTDSHFYHHYELLEKLSKRMDIFLIAEKGEGENIHIQKFKFLPFRLLESFFLILKARRKGYQNFYTHYSYIGGINVAIISRIFGGKSYYWNCAMNWLFKQRTLQRIGYKLCLKWSHFLVTGSEGMKQGYVEHYHLNPERVKVMPNWINLERFKPENSQPKARFAARRAGPPRAEKTLLFVHWLSKRKGADMIIPIMNNLKFKIKNLKLLVIGDGPYKDKLMDEIRENKLEEQINVIGAVSNKDISDYYNRADALIMPSMEEGFPRVLLEAMASGVPYVASDVGAVREISPETAQRFLVKPGDVEMFARKLEILISDEKVYNDFRKEELEKVKEYSLDKVINKFIALFK